MEIGFSGDQIKLDKELNDMDKLALEFLRILDSFGVGYAVVSGYISILFGRSRSSEDIDLIVEKISRNRFFLLWSEITKSFDPIVPDNPASAYDRYLTQGTAIRFARRGKFVPNIEFTFPRTGEIENWVLRNARRVILNGTAIKIFLGSPKDIEDARHLYRLFKEHLDENLFRQFLIKLDKQDRFNRYLA